MSDNTNLTSGRLLARNTVLNLLGTAAPSLVALLSIPYIVHHLGVDRFGVLSLAWVVLGYFSILDLGFGAAATKYVAEALGQGDNERVPKLVWTAVSVQATAGTLGACVLFLSAPFLTTRVLHIGPAFAHEANTMFRLVAISLPIVLVSGSFRGVLSALQRFDLINLVSVPSRVLSFVLPVIAIAIGWNIAGIALLLVISRITIACIYFRLSLRTLPALRMARFHLVELRNLASFGGWVTLSNIAAPTLAQLDRFIVGSILGVTALGYYSAPFEIIQRFWLIPGSFVATVFPAFSTLGTRRRSDLELLFARTLKYLILATSFVLPFSALLCGPFLRVWLGEEFAVHATLAAQILLIGAMPALIAPLPGALLAACGRPDVLPKLYVAEAPLNLLSVWLLVRSLGLPGASLSMALRNLVEITALLVLATRVGRFSARRLILQGSGQAAALGLCLWTAIFFASHATLSISLALATVSGVIFLVCAWLWVLDSRDRRLLRSWILVFAPLGVREWVDLAG